MEDARKAVLKHLLLDLHHGKSSDDVKKQLSRLLGRLPYNEVVAAEQELIAEGLPQEEVLKFCDLHSAAIKGVLDSQVENDKISAGHPVHTFKMENEALSDELDNLEIILREISALPDGMDVSARAAEIRKYFARLADIEKHYRRKEYLLFPYLEKYGITGPPTVMWGKDDEIRELLRGALETLSATGNIQASDAKAAIELVLQPAINAIREMIFKEEEILFPMCLEKLTETEWHSIYAQSPEVGFCLYDPKDKWEAVNIPKPTSSKNDAGKVVFPSGGLTAKELEGILNTIPFDLTFVGADDTVRYFTQGIERIFQRDRAVIGRKVQLCHPPKSVHIVQKILDDFKAGRAGRAPFWINLGGKFIHIEYFAVRDEKGEYLGTLEVTQDLTAKRALEGEQRLLSYGEIKNGNQ
jgi:DUF438 domain-containing protein